MFAVKSIYRSDGTYEVSRKPYRTDQQDDSVEFNDDGCDVYIDIFETYEDALYFINTDMTE